MPGQAGRPPPGGRRDPGALRLTDEALAELRGHLAQIAARFAEPEAEGTWTRLVQVLADLQNRPGLATPARQPRMSNAAGRP